MLHWTYQRQGNRNNIFSKCPCASNAFLKWPGAFKQWPSTPRLHWPKEDRTTGCKIAYRLARKMPSHRIHVECARKHGQKIENTTCESCSACDNRNTGETLVSILTARCGREATAKISRAHQAWSSDVTTEICRRNLMLLSAVLWALVIKC